MPKTTTAKQARKQYTKDERRQHVIAALASGNVGKYEAAHGLSRNIVFNWRRHLPNGVAPDKAASGGKATRDMAEQRAHVAAAFAPGVNTGAYAKAHGLQEQTLYAWYKKHTGMSRADAKRAGQRGAPVLLNGHAAPAPQPAKRVPESAAFPVANGERRTVTAAPSASAAFLRVQVDQLRMEITVLKSVLRLAELRGFKLLDLGTDTDEQKETKHEHD